MSALASPADPFARRLGRRAIENWLPLAVWLGVSAIVLVVVRLAGFDPFRPRVWEQWDAKLYMSQVEHGTTLVRCRGKGVEEWCGTAGWFPGYPWVIDAVRVFGLPVLGTALAVSWAFTGGTLVLLWNTFLDRRLNQASMACLLYAAFAPGIGFRYGLYPMAMLAFFTTWALWMLSRERLVLAGLVGAAALTVYPAAAALIPAAGIWLLRPRSSEPLARRLREAATTCGLMVGGLLLVLGWEWLEVGRLNGYFLVQAKYGHAIREPLAPFHVALSALFGERDLSHPRAVFLETAVFAVALVASLLAVGAAGRRRRFSPADGLVALWVVMTWLLVSAPAHVSYYREESAFVPMSLLVRRLPAALAGTLVALTALVSVPIAILYVRGELP